jgi:uncharacterized protein YndB with AHSA1/START domain
MYEFTTKSMIRSSPERVWEILTDGACYSEWNPEIVAVDGRIALGERIRARVKVGSGAIRSLHVTAFEAPTRMEWTGGLPLGSVPQCEVVWRQCSDSLRQHLDRIRRRRAQH